MPSRVRTSSGPADLEPAQQVTGGVGRADRLGDAREGGSRVQLQHDPEPFARSPRPGQNRPAPRRATPGGQQREVQVDPALRRDVQHRLGSRAPYATTGQQSGASSVSRATNAGSRGRCGLRISRPAVAARSATGLASAALARWGRPAGYRPRRPRGGTPAGRPGRERRPQGPSEHDTHRGFSVVRRTARSAQAHRVDHDPQGSFALPGAADGHTPERPGPAPARPSAGPVASAAAPARRSATPPPPRPVRVRRFPAAAGPAPRTPPPPPPDPPPGPSHRGREARLARSASSRPAKPAGSSDQGLQGRPALSPAAITDPPSAPLRTNASSANAAAPRRRHAGRAGAAVWSCPAALRRRTRPRPAAPPEHGDHDAPGCRDAGQRPPADRGPHRVCRCAPAPPPSGRHHRSPDRPGLADRALVDLAATAPGAHRQRLARLVEPSRPEQNRQWTGSRQPEQTSASR